MRFLQILFLIVTLSNISFAEETNKVSWFHKTFQKLTYKEVIKVSDSPKDICFYVRNRVQYKEDLEDYMKEAIVTWNSKAGDCEDFANCVVTMCKSKGFKAEIKTLFEENNYTGHAIVVGEFNGKRWMSSNGNFQYIDNNQEAQRIIARDMGWDRNKIVMQEYHPSIVNIAKE